MANFRFTFEVTSYTNTSKKDRTWLARATGSQETRARRRLLDQCHKDNVFLRKIKCVEHHPA